MSAQYEITGQALQDIFNSQSFSKELSFSNGAENGSWGPAPEKAIAPAASAPTTKLDI
jgi:hypothetical protein